MILLINWQNTIPHSFLMFETPGVETHQPPAGGAWFRPAGVFFTHAPRA